jgi:carboxylate-amine ligase
MTGSGAIDDYTYLWWDVRPHPNLGTVETRVFDQATRLEDTAAFAALTQALSHRFAELFDEGEPLVEAPFELIDDNKVRAAVRGLEGELVDFTRGCPVPAAEMATGLIAEVESSAAAVGCSEELRRVTEIVAGGTGARRQLDFCSTHDGDLRELVAAAVALTAR